MISGDVLGERTRLSPEAEALVVVDPPRAGLHRDALDALIALAPARLLYVSCHPAGAVEEIALLRERGYVLERVQPVDLFPHTPHLECLFTLSLSAETAPPEANVATMATGDAPG